MSRTLHYLLVGIDSYKSRNINNLDGCVNDVESFDEYLKSRVSSDQFELNGKVLTNQSATKPAIIDGFRSHLSKAKKGDVALFYYAGHGSQEKTKEEFWHLEPDHLNETIVTYESRFENNYDLTDKELSALLSEIESTGAHMTVILDCCHSGSGVRGDEKKTGKSRRAETDQRDRPLESYLLGGKEFKEATRSISTSTQATQTAWPVGGYVLLAACRDHQEAKEHMTTEGKARGAFSYFLGETLRQEGGSLTYRDLYERIETLVRVAKNDQNPQFESTDPAALNALFLDGTVQPRSCYYHVSFDKDRVNWVMKGGAVHGIPVPKGGETFKISLYPYDANDDALRDPSQTIGKATVLAVSATFSTVEMPEDLAKDPSKAYKAITRDLPMDKLVVAFEGDGDGVDQATKALNSSDSNNENAADFIRLAQGQEGPNFRLIADTVDGTTRYIIARPGSDRPVIAPIIGFSAESALKAVQALAHIGRWFATLQLSNPSSSLRLSHSSGDVSDVGIEIRIFEVTQQGDKKETKRITDPEIRLEHRLDTNTNTWTKPAIQVEVVNKSDRVLWVALLNLTEQFGVFTGFQQATSVKLNPGESHWAQTKVQGRWVKDIPVFVSKADHENGVEEIKDNLQLVVATAEFNIKIAEQPDLEKSTELKRSLGQFQIRSGLERMLQKAQTRAIGGDDEQEVVLDDWATANFSFVTYWPLESKSVPATGDSPSLVSGVKVRPHNSLVAKIKVATDPVASRSLGTFALPSLIKNFIEGVEPLQLVKPISTRSATSTASVIEIADIVDRTAVSPENPLVLEIESPLESDEFVLPYAFDGEFFIPVGKANESRTSSPGSLHASRGTKPGLEILIERLPEAHTSEAMNKSQTRSILKSVKIFFLKIKTNLFGGEFHFPRLAAADMAEKDGKPLVVFVDTTDDLKVRVQNAQNILVLIHGIFGDCESMRVGLHEALSSQPTGEAAAKADLVLAFDYENLNTPIENVARDLGTKLASVGLTPGHGKSLTILAHSMGGLVSRWFIEKEGGDKVVSKLIMMGTPNAGSPWPGYQDWATSSLTLALNGLTTIAWPASVLGMLMAAIEMVDTSMDQMKPASPLLKTLGENPATGVPFHLIAGNTSLSPSALHVDAAGNTTLAAKVLQRVISKPRLQGVIDLFFSDKPNDIAVTVESMKSFPTAWKEKVAVNEVPCDHLSYFRHDGSREKLIALLLA